MTIEEATKHLMRISYLLGSIGVEYLTEKDGEKIREAIKVLQQDPRWIPCNERLPEVDEEACSNSVLISLRKTVSLWDNECQTVYITKIAYYDENAISSDGRYMDTEGWVLENGNTLSMDKVIAWMPLPQAYKEVEE